MSSSSDRHVSVLATGAHLPGEPLDNDALARICGPLPDDVLEASRSSAVTG